MIRSDRDFEVLQTLLDTYDSQTVKCMLEQLYVCYERSNNNQELISGAEARKMLEASLENVR